MILTRGACIMVAMKIGDRVKLRRLELGLSQEDLAEEIGISYQSIGQWESGKTAPRQNKLPVLALTLKTTQEWLQFGSGEKIATKAAKAFRPDRLKFHARIDEMTPDQLQALEIFFRTVDAFSSAPKQQSSRHRAKKPKLAT